MKIKQVIDEIRKIMAKHDGPEKELYEELVAEAAGWSMRLQEIEAEEEDKS